MRKCSLLLSIVISTTVFAEGQCNSAGCISTISDLYTNAEGRIYVGTPHDEKAANCTPIADIYFTVNPKAQNAEEMYSTLLAAYMSNKKVQLRVREGHSKCELAYVRLNTNF